MASKCVECENLADHHDLCHSCHAWYRKRLENVTIEKVEEMPETEEDNEEQISTLMCGKCGDICAVHETVREKYKNVRWRCPSCLYGWL